MEAFSHELGEPLRVKSATTAQREKIDRDCPGRFEWVEALDCNDYVYRQEDLSLLRGKKYHGKRNHIAQFVKGKGGRVRGSICACFGVFAASAPSPLGAGIPCCP